MEGLGTGVWDLPMVTSIAFPRAGAASGLPDGGPPAEPIAAKYKDATTGPIRDGSFEISDGDGGGRFSIAYRFHTPADPAAVKVVLCSFHGNGEDCTSLTGMDEYGQDDFVKVLHAAGAAVLSIDYRGYSWGTGTPSLTKLCNDAEQCFAACRALSEGAGCGSAKVVVHGRSIGATCAVHLASKYGSNVHGIIVDSGLMSLKRLPMVQQMACNPMVVQMLFQGNPMGFEMLQEPFDTPGKLSAISCPTLVMHGDQDEIIPLAQANECHDKCAAPQKKLRVWPGGRHNDIRSKYDGEWKKEVMALIGMASEFSCPCPAGAFVEKADGTQGRVLGPAAEKVRVSFAEPMGEQVVSPADLRVISAEALQSDSLQLLLLGDFPLGPLVVEAHSLTAAALNGALGRVLGPKGERVRVQFPEPHGEKAVKPANLKVVPTSALKDEDRRLLNILVEDFPVGAMVEAHSLSDAALNGERGRVVRPVGTERVVVEFGALSGEKSLKPANLKVVGVEGGVTSPASVVRQSSRPSEASIWGCCGLQL